MLTGVKEDPSSHIAHFFISANCLNDSDTHYGVETPELNCKQTEDFFLDLPPEDRRKEEA